MIRATYRLQLGPSLDFARVTGLLDYLDGLGVSHLYLSPIWKARTGSTHGYDVVDPTRLNPALGDFTALSRAAHSRGMGIVCDIVPNHMAASRENAWWWDVLRRGRDSEYARVFDVDWERGDGKVVTPLDDVPGEGRCVRGPASYRRFFDIDDLVGVRVEDPSVFDLTHALVCELVASGLVDGLRVDHVDGLRDPRGYLERLRSRVGGGAYIVVEKILERDEELPRDWPCAGTTGYELADRVDGLFVDGAGVRGARAFGRVAEAAKRQVVDELFAGEVDALAARLGGGREAIAETTVALDVYRTYGTVHGFSPADRARIRAAARRARPRVHDRAALDAFVRLLLTQRPTGAWADVVAAWQQLTVPAMAKGYEDTALYRFPLLTSRNEVGADPARPAVTVEEFHAFNAARARRRPLAMNAGSTHDSKRGEDVRARISVLSEMRAEWDATLAGWIRAEPPSRDDQELFFQTLVGAWPADAQRMKRVMRKSVREAKVHTSWRRPDEAYEDAMDRFVDEVYADTTAIGAFVARIAPAGDVNALAGVVLRAASPGVPDVYQGAETWYRRLVDPDNRDPVDFGADESVKTTVLRRALAARREHPELFASGAYVPLAVRGRLRRHVVAFARRRGREWAIASVPRLIARFDSPVGEVWRGTRLELPARAPERWRNAITGDEVTSLDLADVLRELPVAILLAANTKRGHSAAARTVK